MSNNKNSDAYYNLITDLGKKIGDLKGYDYGYILPSAGMMIVSYNGTNFLVKAEILSSANDVSISDELNNNKHRFISRIQQITEETET